ncbi:uncharacterized protein UV8b_05290 [Ustilaginoidea virens]|uniref:WW domain-containing protein n=1 Tax=Ustilaginoidea virens TaxID=1159556 RepID=A0A063C5K8_USTVR|nr:uncharacterized protein UV8b_05290 [Ustilaginoidea virens]QUC21049.1 hypothetical protein UV8b_05290 [Ustilaginoidea virens]GAO14642.1 hypothetical protein UVI_02009060 [Ustilaginoidea virens]
MLKSTYKPSVAAAPLPPGWTEHTAPTGHKYYHNTETNVSTYQRPGAAPQAPQPARDAYSPYAHLPSLADPRVANAYLAQANAQQNRPRDPRDRGRASGGHDRRPRPQPVDKPRRVEEIPGCEPWVLVYTKYSRRFAHNPVKKASYWRIPDKLTQGILELDKARIRDKAAGQQAGVNNGQDVVSEPREQTAPQRQDESDSDEYEEVEVEVEVSDDDDDGDGDGDDDDDDEGGGGGGKGNCGDDGDAESEHPSKRRRTGHASRGDGTGGQGDGQHGPVEFTEADIAAQLQAMGEDYGLEPGDYDDGNMENWPEGTHGVDFSQDDAKALFKDLLNDLGVNPYSPWDKTLEQGGLVNDPRYTALDTTRARKECWDEWARGKIAELKEARARQETKDPRVAYMAFLQQKATPKLYWPEFRRKYRKEEPMRDPRLRDKDREKAYREHINRLKLPLATLKADLAALLRSQPARLLHSQSSTANLPAQVLVDSRYVSLDPRIRDPLVEAYVQGLPPPPEDAAAAAAAAAAGGGDENDEARAREARARRERALRERNCAVEEQKRRRDRELAASKARLRDEERELESAMRVGKRGLQSQLAEASHAGNQDSESLM